MNVSVMIGVLIPFIGTSLGAAFVFFMKRQLGRSVQRALTGFAAGVMTAASIWSLLIPAIEQNKSMGAFAFVPAVKGVIAVKKRNRIIALLLAVIVLFVMAFSLAVVAVEANHECCGEDCPICKLIAVCENNIRGMSLILVFVSLLVALALMRTFFRDTRAFLFRSQTPVPLKVKLTN